MVKKPPKCISCSRQLTAWGKTASGKKRYRCSNCGITRIYRQNTNNSSLFSLFRQYILWGLTYEMLSSLYGYSIRFLEEKFHAYLEQAPLEAPFIQNPNKEAYLLIDGLWFGRWFVLMVYRQSGNLTILHISSMGREAATRIEKDLKKIKQNYIFNGIVSDGGTGIVSAINTVFPHTPHQICLAHMHRGIISAIGRYSKDYRVQELRRLADHVWLIESQEALKWWREKLNNWVKINNEFLKEKRYDIDYNWWHIHKGPRKAVRTLQELPYTSFTFLRHPLMPKTTNEIESQFGHLGKRWLAHRGLKKQRWEHFLKWFVYFYNQEKQSLKVLTVIPIGNYRKAQKKTKED